MSTFLLAINILSVINSSFCPLGSGFNIKIQLIILDAGKVQEFTNKPGVINFICSELCNFGMD